MVPAIIETLMRVQRGRVHRDPSEQPTVRRRLEELSIETSTQLGQFFMTFSLGGVLSVRDIELLDLCSPSAQIRDATKFGREIYGVENQFICLTSGEDEGFVLYSISDESVYDVGVNELKRLPDGIVTPRWKSFNDLIIWYLQPN